MHTGCILGIDLLDRQLSNLKYEKTKREKSTKVCKKPLRFIMEFSSYSTLLLSLIYALTHTHAYLAVMCVSVWNVSQAQNNGKSR